MKYTVDEIFKIFEESGIIIYNSTLSGDYRINNREGKRLIKFFKIFENEYKGQYT